MIQPEPEGSTHGYPLDSVESLGMMKKGENVNLGNMWTNTELNTGTNPTRCLVMAYLST